VAAEEAVCLLCVYCVSTVCLLCVYCVSTVCLLCVYCVSTVCLLCVYFVSTVSCGCLSLLQLRWLVLVCGHALAPSSPSRRHSTRASRVA